MTARRTWRRARRGLTTSLALGVLLAPTAALAATGADADEPAPTTSVTTCDRAGFPSEHKVESRGGGQTGSVGGPWGSADWSGRTITWTLEEGASVELCVKYGGGHDGAEPETFTVTDSGSTTFPRGISHVSWRDAVLVDPDEPGDDDGSDDDAGADDDAGTDDDGTDDGGGAPACVEYTTEQQATWLRSGGSDVAAGTADVRLGDIPTDSCDFPVNLTSYQLPGGEMLPFDEQVLFDNVTVTVGPGGVDEVLEVALPDCAWQTDLYTGPVLETAPHHTPIDVLVAHDLFTTSGDGAIPCDDVEVDPDCVTYTAVEQAEFLRDAGSSVEGGSALVVAGAIPSDSCPFEVHFTSYELPGGSMLPYEDQILHDNVTTTVSPGDPLTELLVSLPDCAWQTDLYTGEVKLTAPHHLPENVLVAADLSEGTPCDDGGEDDDGGDDAGTDDGAGADDDAGTDDGGDDAGTDDGVGADDDAGTDDGVGSEDGDQTDGADDGVGSDDGADDGADDGVGSDDGDQTDDDGADDDGADDGTDAGADDGDTSVGGVVIDGTDDADGDPAGDGAGVTVTVTPAGDDAEVLGVSPAALPTTGGQAVPLAALALLLLLLGGTVVGATRVTGGRAAG